MPLEVTIRGRRVASDATPAEGGRRVAFRGAGKGTSVRAICIGATRTTRTLLSPGLEPKFFGVEIADGTTRYEVELAHDDPAAQVGLYLYKEPEGERREQILRSDQTALVGYDPSFQPRKRSEARRVGKECVRTCRSRWEPDTIKKNNTKKQRQAR